MKKFLLSLVAFVCALAVNAETVVTFDNTVTGWTGTAGAQTATLNGVTIETGQGILATSGEYRIYKSQSLKVSSTVGNITKIEFTCTASGETKYGPGCFAAPEVGTYTFEGKNGVWTGDAAEVSLVASSNQVRATQIVVTVSGDAPTAPVIKAPTITVDGAKVTITAAEGYGIIYTTDGSTPVDGNGTAVTSNTVEFTAEASCTVKAITVDNDDPDNCSSVASASVTVTKVFNTPETALTVAEALAFIQAGDKLDQYVYTKGEIHYISDLSTSYGNATYSITDGTDTLIVYRGMGLNNAKFTAEDDIYVGDKVIVYGLLVNYKDVTPEYTTGNYIVSQEKVERPTTIDPNDPFNGYEVTADGSLANPYSAKDLVYFYKKNGQKYPEGKQWVKGTIYGSVKSFSKDQCVLADAAATSNIALGDDEYKVGVALPTGDVRAAINLVDNPDNIGKEVWVYGTLEAYFSFAGVKNVTDFSFDGESQYTAISSVAAESKSAVLYNLSGQKVANNFKGIVIIGGKKIVR